MGFETMIAPIPVTMKVYSPHKGTARFMGIEMRNSREWRCRSVPPTKGLPTLSALRHDLFKDGVLVDVDPQRDCPLYGL